MKDNPAKVRIYWLEGHSDFESEYMLYWKTQYMQYLLYHIEGIFDLMHCSLGDQQCALLKQWSICREERCAEDYILFALYSVKKVVILQSRAHYDYML